MTFWKFVSEQNLRSRNNPLTIDDETDIPQKG